MTIHLTISVFSALLDQRDARVLAIELQGDLDFWTLEWATGQLPDSAPAGNQGTQAPDSTLASRARIACRSAGSA